MVVGSTALAAASPLDNPQCVPVVVVRAGNGLKDDRDGGHHERREQRTPKGVDCDEVGKRVGGQNQPERVHDQHQQEAEREHEREAERRHQGREDGVHNGNHRGDQQS